MPLKIGIDGTIGNEKMEEYNKAELIAVLTEMFQHFLKMDPDKVFFSEKSIKDALDEYGYENVQNWFETSASTDCKKHSPELKKMFEFSTRVSEICFFQTLEEMEKAGLGVFGVDKKGEISFMLSEKGNKARKDIDY